VNDAAKPMISIEHVSKRYGDFVAVHETSFEIRSAEFFSMLGPSGCGKTTMLRMIAGFEEVTTGVLRLDGVDMVGVPPYRRPVNTVFQNYALFPHLSVFDNVAFGPRIRGADPAQLDRRVREMLEVVRLGDFAKRKPHQLSGGQRQRVALARALVNDPKALLLDEPLSALDAELRRQMQLELKRIQRDIGITFVFVTHDQEEALTMSDRIAVMRTGHLEQVGTPEQIYDEPASAFVARFIGSANLIPVTVERVNGARSTVALPGGRSAEAVTGAAALPAGSKALLMVRPERVHVGTEQPAPGRVALPMTCTDLVFQGAQLRCALRDGHSPEVVVHIEPDEPREGVVPGAQVWVSWPIDAGRVIPPEAEAAQPAAAERESAA
jgi:spermidine/putrescine transport system ATP-binding protein